MIRTFILASVLSLASLASFAQEIWTIGPMLHFNFGEKRSLSFAIEGAYWNISGFPYGADFAIEFDKGKIRLYSEAQTGVGLTGIALGPVLEFNRIEHKTRLGLQGSVWANYYIGMDYRFRVIDKTTVHAIGLYGKLPIATTGLDESSESSWGDWDDWD